MIEKPIIASRAKFVIGGKTRRGGGILLKGRKSFCIESQKARSMDGAEMVPGAKRERLYLNEGERGEGDWGGRYVSQNVHGERWTAL